MVGRERRGPPKPQYPQIGPRSHPSGIIPPLLDPPHQLVLALRRHEHIVASLEVAEAGDLAGLDAVAADFLAPCDVAQISRCLLWSASQPSSRSRPQPD